MRLPLSTQLPLALLIGGWLFTSSSPAKAQGYGPSPILGGSGAMSGDALRGGGGSMIPIPYAGGFTGFMPYRMAGGGALAFRARPAPAMGPARTSFSLSPMTGGMSPGSGRMGAGLGMGGRFVSSLGSRGGLEMGGVGLGTSRPGSSSMGIMPPSIGYPFRQPPSLLSPSSGMSMSMP